MRNSTLFLFGLGLLGTILIVRALSSKPAGGDDGGDGGGTFVVTMTGVPTSITNETLIISVTATAHRIPSGSNNFYASYRIAGPGGVSAQGSWLMEEGVAQEISLWTAISQYEQLPAGSYQIQAKLGGEISESGWVNIGKTITLT